MNKLNSLNKKLEEYTGQIKNNRQRFLPFVSTTVAAIERSDFTDQELRELKDFFREMSQHFPSPSELQSVYDQLNPIFIYNKIYPMLEKRLQKEITDAYIALLGIKNDQNKSPMPEEQINKLFEVISRYPDRFESKEYEISKAIEEVFSERSYLSHFIKSNLQNTFITAKAIDKFVATIASTDPDLDDKLELLITLNLSNNVNIVVGKLAELIQFESSQEVTDKRISLLKPLDVLTANYKAHLDNLEDKILIQQISANIRKWYSQDGNWDKRMVIANTIYNLKNINGNPVNAELESNIRDFVMNAPIEVYRKLGKKRLKQLVIEFPNEFRNASIRDLAILTLGLKDLDVKEVPSLVTNLLDKARSLPSSSEKKPYFDYIVKLKCAGDPSLVNQFHADLVTLKSNDPELLKKYARTRGIFNASQKLELK